MAFEFIYDVSLFKWNTGTVRIIAEYDVAGGVAGIIFNQICIKEGLFPKYTHIYIYIYINIVFFSKTGLG